MSIKLNKERSMTPVSILIDIYKMTDVSDEVRIKLIIEMGKIINYEHAYNLTEGVVLELVKLIDQNHPILNDNHYKKHAIKI